MDIHRLLFDRTIKIQTSKVNEGATINPPQTNRVKRINSVYVVNPKWGK